LLYLLSYSLISYGIHTAYVCSFSLLSHPNYARKCARYDAVQTPPQVSGTTETTNDTLVLEGIDRSSF
jgi:hypothetical protein